MAYTLQRIRGSHLTYELLNNILTKSFKAGCISRQCTNPIASFLDSCTTNLPRYPVAPATITFCIFSIPFQNFVIDAYVIKQNYFRNMILSPRMEKPVVPPTESAKRKVMVFSHSFKIPFLSSMITVFGAMSATISAGSFTFWSFINISVSVTPSISKPVT